MYIIKQIVYYVKTQQCIIIGILLWQHVSVFLYTIFRPTFYIYSAHIHRCSTWFPRVTRQMVAWIGRSETIAWPPRSPDLTPLDFSVWGYVKDQVFPPTSSCKFGRTMGTENRSGCDHRCGHDS